MSFTVKWKPDARRELHELWILAPVPDAVWTADAEAKRRLAQDPFAAGRLLSEGLWLAIVPPLAIFYDIDPVRRIVNVTDVGTLADPPAPEATS